jgi:hypothetical protein
VTSAGTSATDSSAMQSFITFFPVAPQTCV